ncbi:hypothetical protein BAU07_26130 (plasmid) [Bordetella flabilis]|uniref:Toxin co-regulated pilus biosynthesis protein Q C-terminal domain-containing protein n=2 Tax=Bordetella flabilis TaxID=463014 RepID=A0A193GMV1_9BORD|nr:hypothetical protein BAU07_26130 [Bordetella flabilis]
MSQAAPGAAQSDGSSDQARKLLAEDATKIIKQAPAQAAGATNKPLADKTSKPEAPKSNGKPSAPSPEPVKAEETKAVAAEQKSDVVEVKPTADAEPLPSWIANAGTTLRQTVQDWSHREGWDVRWEAELLDYPIEERFTMVGKYLDVITRTFELYKDAKRPFKVEIYPSQKLVVVKEKK